MRTLQRHNPNLYQVNLSFYVPCRKTNKWTGDADSSYPFGKAGGGGAHHGSVGDSSIKDRLDWADEAGLSWTNWAKKQNPGLIHLLMLWFVGADSLHQAGPPSVGGRRSWTLVDCFVLPQTWLTEVFWGSVSLEESWKSTHSSVHCTSLQGDSNMLCFFDNATEKKNLILKTKVKDKISALTKLPLVC